MKVKLFLALLFFAFSVYAKDAVTTLKLDLPIFDLPYQISAMETVGYGFFSSYANPGMAQSLAVTVDMFSGFHYGMRTFYDTSNMNYIFRNIIYYGGTALGDTLLFYLPFGSAKWMHEEYHRAVMSRYGVNSFNSVYTFSSSVIKITDEDLIRFKAESPAAFVRMHGAGFEGEYLFADTLQKNNFFYNKNYFTELVYWAIYIPASSYMFQNGWKR